VFHGFAITRGDNMLAKLAQEIVNITSEVIGHDVLITDKDGMVLGSSDKPGNSCWGHSAKWRNY
jgi:hypothetical protein